MEVKAISQGRQQLGNFKNVSSDIELDTNVEKNKFNEKHGILDKESTKEVKDSVDKLTSY